MHFPNCIVIFVLMVRHGISTPLQQITTATLAPRFRIESQPQWRVEFKPKNLTAHMQTVEQIEVSITSKFANNGLNCAKCLYKENLLYCIGK